MSHKFVLLKIRVLVKDYNYSVFSKSNYVKIVFKNVLREAHCSLCNVMRNLPGKEITMQWEN